MTYTVNDKCIMCKHTDCVLVCPVDCFYEGENMLVINPDECIDCGVCEPECPEDAILPDTDEEGAKWVSSTVSGLNNGRFSQIKKIQYPIMKNTQVKQTNYKNILKTNDHRQDKRNR